MSKKWLFISIITVILIFIFYGIFTLLSEPVTRMRVIKRVAPNTIIEGSLPDEWGENFDPTLNPSTFKIDEKMNLENRLKLSYVFPPVKEGQKVESVLVCEHGIEARTQGKKGGKKVNTEQAISLIDLEKNTIMITGYCSDLLCSAIVGNCSIYMSDKSK